MAIRPTGAIRVAEVNSPVSSDVIPAARINKHWLARNLLPPLPISQHFSTCRFQEPAPIQGIGLTPQGTACAGIVIDYIAVAGDVDNRITRNPGGII